MTNEIKATSVSEAIGTVIAKLCYRASDDLGEGFSEKTGEWRRGNALTILNNADKKYNDISITGKEQAHPRLVHHIIEEGSWTDSTHVQNMWSGLLASSCTESGDDESNLIFINLLKQISSVQALILNYACENCATVLTEGGWIGAEPISIQLDKLIEITETDDIHRLDRELDHLRSIEIIYGGFEPDSTTAEITPTALALQLYVRCHGYIGSPIDYFDLSENNQP